MFRRANGTYNFKSTHIDNLNFAGVGVCYEGVLTIRMHKNIYRSWGMIENFLYQFVFTGNLNGSYLLSGIPVIYRNTAVVCIRYQGSSFRL